MRHKILKLLSCNSRMPFGDIATMLGIPLEEIEAEIKLMEEEKIILKYGTVINWEKLDEGEKVEAYIDVQVAPQRDTGFDTIAARIYRFPEVRAVALMSGAYDLSVHIIGKSMKEVAFFVAEKLSTIEHVQSTKTHFLLKRYKQAGVIFEETEEDRRQVFVP